MTENEGIKWTIERLDQLNYDDVYALGSFSKGQEKHWQILAELLGVNKNFAWLIQERWPNA